MVLGKLARLGESAIIFKECETLSKQIPTSDGIAFAKKSLVFLGHCGAQGEAALAEAEKEPERVNAQRILGSLHEQMRQTELTKVWEHNAGDASAMMAGEVFIPVFNRYKEAATLTLHKVRVAQNRERAEGAESEEAANQPTSSTDDVMVSIAEEAETVFRSTDKQNRGSIAQAE